MATEILIDETNFATLLVQSTQGRSGTPDGNIFFDKSNGLFEIITSDELAQVDLGSGLEANPLSSDLGITSRALYNFERQERKVDETLRKFDLYFKGSYKFAGAYELINGRKITGNDRNKIRKSGLIERAVNGNVDRGYFGVQSLNNIDVDSQPYYMFADSTSEADLQAAAPADFIRLGAIDEMIQVFGSTANGDAGAGDFNNTTKVLVISTRKFGNNYGRTDSIKTGVTEMSGFSAGFGIGESPNNKNSFDIADVFGGAQIAPWTGMGLEVFAANQQRSGFISGTADFDIIINNVNSGSLDECTAFLDALALQDTDIDDGAGSVLGKRSDVFYTRNDAGQVVTAVGLHIDNLPESDKQTIIMTDVSGVGQTFPFNNDVRIETGQFAITDPNAWYQVYYLDGAADADFNKDNAVTVQDAVGADVKGNVATDAVGTEIRFSYAYDTNTQAGLPAGEDKPMVVEVEGNGIATAAKTVFTVVRQSIINVTCAPDQETNT